MAATDACRARCSILDEVQQYIGDSNDRSVLVTEVAEAVSQAARQPGNGRRCRPERADRRAAAA